MGRAPCCEKVGMKKGRWTSEEDEILRKYILDHGEGSWRSLPKNAGLSRCGKSCRLRWVNYLRDDLKRGNITKEEEETIVKLHTSIGNRWSVIAAHLPGRTDNEIKNYWNSHISRKIYSFRHGISGIKPVSINLIKVSSKRKGGRPTKKKNKQQQQQQQQQAANESTTRDEHEKSARSEQGEGMVIDSSNEKGRGGPSCESGPHLLMDEEGDEGPMGVHVGEEGKEGPSSYEEGEVDDWFDWDSQGSEAKIWDDIDDIWPMGWEMMWESTGCKL